MKRKQGKQRILILGASGFIGNAIYGELLSYFEVHGTYCEQQGAFSENQVFTKYRVETDSMFVLLNEIKPTVIISAISGDFQSQLIAHQELVNYALINPECSILYVSSAAVFDGKLKHPAYEDDFTCSDTKEGRFKISIENLLLASIPSQVAILRLPLVLGINSPGIVQLRQSIRHQATFEVYPNLILSATTIDKVIQQIHYIINHSLKGIFHLASNDMIHHEDLFKEITEKIGNIMPIFKSVFRRNENEYHAILPKKNTFPEIMQITISQVIEECSLNEEIISIK